MDEIRIPAAGDPFTSAPRRDGDDEVDWRCMCHSGVVYLTYEEDGHERAEPAPCRRCNR
jgi:hypothetical protein